MKRFVKKLLYSLTRFFCSAYIVEGCSRIVRFWVTNAYAKRFRSVGDRLHLGKNPSFRGQQYISVGDDFSAGDGLLMEAWDAYRDQTFTPQICIGNGVNCSNYVQISAIDRVTIGDHVLMGQCVYISDNNHGKWNAEELRLPPTQRPLTSKGPVSIGNNVWLGRCVTVLSGVTIGDNCVIGANSVVTKDIPPNCMAAGVPAKVVKRLDQDT